MEITTQLSVFVANEPGILANLCGSLTDEKVTIKGISVVDHTDYAVIRLVVSDARKAAHLLGEAGLFVIESEVILLELPESPGSLEKVLRILAENNMNVLYLYGTEPGSCDSVIYINTSNNRSALAALAKDLRV